MRHIGRMLGFKGLALLSGAVLLGQGNCNIQIGDILVTTFARTLSNSVGVFFEGIFANLFMTA